MMAHDGAPTHFYAYVRDWLNMAYPGHYFRHMGTVLWLPRSPDHTPLDFFLMGPSQAIGVPRHTEYTQTELIAASTSVRC
ncbi:uncharacterized protein TNCV_3400931 [Trichonephila clavipes]|nr:uncharacterized protein TNCV_3400931 [Trichonephila clavipes]